MLFQGEGYVGFDRWLWDHQKLTMPRRHRSQWHLTKWGLRFTRRTARLLIQYLIERAVAAVLMQSVLVAVLEKGRVEGRP